MNTSLQKASKIYKKLWIHPKKFCEFRLWTLVQTHLILLIPFLLTAFCLLFSMLPLICFEFKISTLHSRQERFLIIYLINLFSIWIGFKNWSISYTLWITAWLSLSNLDTECLAVFLLILFFWQSSELQQIDGERLKDEKER